MITHFISGIILNLFDPVKWILVSIPVVSLIKSGTVPAPPSADGSTHWYHEPVSAWMIGAFLGAVVALLYTSTPWIFNFLSSLIMAGLVCWFRLLWLRKKEKKSIPTHVTVGGATVKAGWDAKTNPFPTGDESKGKTTKFTAGGETYWDTKLKNSQVIKNTSTEYDQVQTVREASGRWHRTYYRKGKGVAPLIKLASSDPVSGVTTKGEDKKVKTEWRREKFREAYTHEEKGVTSTSKAYNNPQSAPTHEEKGVTSTPKASKNQRSAPTDEKSYGIAWKELKDGSIDEALWARLWVVNDGDEKKTEIAYLKERVERLNNLKDT